MAARQSQLLRRPIRRAARLVARRLAPAPLRALLARVPFSRYHGVARWLLRGAEEIGWRGVRVAVDPGTVMGYHVYMLDAYGQEEIDALIGLCRGASLFADLGANAGLVSLALARACPGLRVVAFEPDRQIAAAFRANLARNPDLAPRLSLVEQAVGAAVGESWFSPSASAENPEIGRLDAAGAGRYAVPVTSLDAHFAGGPAPDVVKIDVEGGELAALRGMAGLWAAGAPRAMLVECHGYLAADAAAFNAELVGLLCAARWSLARLEGGVWRPLAAGLGAAPRAHLLATRPAETPR